MKQIITFLFFLLSISINAADLLVYPSASFPDFSSIQTAVDSSSDGDRILVATGTYNGDIDFYHKNISILPVTSSDAFTIIGDINFHQIITSPTLKKITVSSAQILGEIGVLGNLMTAYEFNMIGCDMFGRVSLNSDNISTNLYYSNFYNSILLNHSSEIVGNIFSSSTNSNYYDTLLVHKGIVNIPSFQNTDLKIFANKIDGYRLLCDLYQGNSTNKIHISNNYIKSDQSSSVNSVDLINISGPSNICWFENNTIKKDMTPNSNTASSFISIYSPYSSSSLVMIEIRNNNFLIEYNPGSGAFFTFNFSTSTITNLRNNFFNWDVSNGSTLLFRNNAFPSVFFESDNIYDPSFYTNINSTTLNDTNGIPLTTLLVATENLGLDVIDCRDIDDTQNNIGPWGGPHSWANYHTPSIGKGKIIDINLISTFGSSSNSTLNIRSKAVITK